MLRVARALATHEFLERTRDRWVVVISLLFALMATGVTLYGRAAEENAAMLTGPSLVTLTSLLVPLVALVLGHDCICGERERNTLGLLLSLPASAGELVIAKLIGRMLALTVSVLVGLGAALLLVDAAGRASLVWLLGPTLLLGASFLVLGAFLSVVAQRPATSASLAVAAWFLLVFFYDLGLLGLLILTDGAVATDTIGALVIANPAGLYRVEMMTFFSGPTGFEELSQASLVPSRLTVACVWLAWTLGLAFVTSVLLHRRRSHR